MVNDLSLTCKPHIADMMHFASPHGNRAGAQPPWGIWEPHSSSRRRVWMRYNRPSPTARIRKGRLGNGELYEALLTNKSPRVSTTDYLGSLKVQVHDLAIS